MGFFSTLNNIFFLTRKLNCYHLVHAYGVIPGPNHILLVMELMSRGDLLNYIRSLKAEENDIFTVLRLEVSYSVIYVQYLMFNTRGSCQFHFLHKDVIHLHMDVLDYLSGFFRSYYLE